MKTVKKSFYALEIFVQPGGARKAEVHVFDNLERIQQTLDDELSLAINIYLLAWYGEDIFLLTYRDGAEVQKIPMLPRIRLKIKGYPEIWFDETNQMRGIKFKGLDYRQGWAENESRVVNDETFIDKMIEDKLKFSATVDWDAVNVEPFAGEAAKPGDHLIVFSNYTKEKIKVGYGFNELETGEYEDETVGANLDLDEEDDEEE